MKNLFYCFLTSLLVIVGSSFARAQLVINEIMQSNIDCVMDDINEFPDSWVELYNNSSVAANLRYYSIGLSDDPAEAFPLPQVRVTAHRYALIYCDKESSGLHTSFRLESNKTGAIYLFKGDSLVDKLERIPKQPSPNIAYGRLNEESNEWGWQLTPTPKEANCGQLASTVLSAPIFSPRGSLITHRRPIEVTLTAPKGTPAGAEIHYTLDGSEPTVKSALYTTPLSLTESSVVRAKIFMNGCVSARSHAESYLRLDHETTLPIVSIMTDERYLYNDAIGIYTAGNNTNYDKDWRRPMNFEFFERADTTSVLNQLCEARIHGCTSRKRSLKSLAFYANKRFGEKRFAYEFFPIDRPGEKDYQSFVLRDGGSDIYGLYMRDGLMQRAAAWNCDLDYEGHRAAIVFMNGKYWGIQNLRERSNDKNIECNYDTEDIDVIKNNWEVCAGDNVNWQAFQAFYKETGHTWDEYEKWMDCQEYINLMVMELFYNNVDFPACNIICWRPRTERDGYPARWRWIVKDCEMGMGFGGMTSTWDVMAWFYDPNFSTNYAWANTYDGTRLLRRLMNDKTFRKRFIDCAMVYMGDFLNYDNIWNQVWRDMYGEIKDEFAYHHALYINDYPSSFSYQREMDYTKQWLEERPWYFASSIGKQYELGTPLPVSVLVDTASRTSAEAGYSATYTLNQTYHHSIYHTFTYTYNDIAVRNPNYHSYDFVNRPVTLRGEREATWRVVLHTAKDSTVSVVNGESCTFTMGSRHVGANVYVQPSELTDGLPTPLIESSSIGSKFIHDGHILIRRNGKTYDLLGHILK
ncbi:MAG: CotH kinase family protein [Paludibacteraceae bacterium]|nr:CotH kinase family protein [Paludibacteraceae bacterium]